MISLVTAVHHQKQQNYLIDYVYTDIMQRTDSCITKLRQSTNECVTNVQQRSYIWNKYQAENK